MKSNTRWIALATLLACVLGMSPTMTSAAPEKQKADSVTVTIELWRTSDAETVAAIEALTNTNPADAEPVRAALAAAEDKAARGCRFVTPTKFGKLVKHSDNAEKVFQSQKPSGVHAGVSFGGFQSEGSSLVMTARKAADKHIEVELDLKSSSAGKMRQLPDGSVIPGDRVRSAVKGSVIGPSGTTRFFTSQSESNGLVVIFVRAQRLD